MMMSCVRIGIAASMLGVCNRTIRRWDAAGKISCTRTPGGHRRLSMATIDARDTSKRCSACGTIVDARDTSKRCSACGTIGNRHGKTFSCTNVDCAKMVDSDLNGSRNVRLAPSSPRPHAKGEGARHRPLACHASTSLNRDEFGFMSKFVAV
jgi:excisionase family DNA binding protein